MKFVVGLLLIFLATVSIGGAVQGLSRGSITLEHRFSFRKSTFRRRTDPAKFWFITILTLVIGMVALASGLERLIGP